MRFAGGRHLKRIVVKFRKLMKKPLLETAGHVRYRQLLQHSTNSLRSSSVRRNMISDIPEGCLAVYVGKERQRFVVPMSYLSHRLMKALLEKSAKEFDYRYSNGILIACEVNTFRELLWLIENNHPSAQTIDVAELINS